VRQEDQTDEKDVIRDDVENEGERERVSYAAAHDQRSFTHGKLLTLFGAV
jgi:hypothetical protein